MTVNELIEELNNIKDACKSGDLDITVLSSCNRNMEIHNVDVEYSGVFKVVILS